MAYSPEGKRILSGGFRTAKLWDAETGKPLLKLEVPANSVLSVAFSPDGKRILAGSDDSIARVWDAETGKPLFELEGHGGSILSVTFSPDGKYILTGSEDKTARIWDAETGKPLLLTLQGHSDDVESLAFSPDGKRILTVDGADKAARVWAVPPILLAGPKDQVRMGCEKLWKARAPLNFTSADAINYPVLKGEPVDPGSGDLVSPCRGVLPDDVFTKQAN